MELKPFDIVLLEGQWYKPYHWPIQWRGLDSSVHCFPVLYPSTEFLKTQILDIELKGLEDSTLEEYKGRKARIYRYSKELDYDKLYRWLYQKQSTSTGYDLINQYLFGFILGIVDKYADDETKWTCSELCYWLFQDNDYKITSKDERLPMPRIFAFNNDFNCIFDGKL